jgi:hypothetical protein
MYSLSIIIGLKWYNPTKELNFGSKKAIVGLSWMDVSYISQP